MASITTTGAEERTAAMLSIQLEAQEGKGAKMGLRGVISTVVLRAVNVKGNMSRACSTAGDKHVDISFSPAMGARANCDSQQHQKHKSMSRRR
jgi:hypothetical protein